MLHTKTSEYPKWFLQLQKKRSSLSSLKQHKQTVHYIDWMSTSHLICCHDIIIFSFVIFTIFLGNVPLSTYFGILAIWMAVEFFCCIIHQNEILLHVLFLLYAIRTDEYYKETNELQSILRNSVFEKGRECIFLLTQVF